MRPVSFVLAAIAVLLSGCSAMRASDAPVIVTHPPDDWGPGMGMSFGPGENRTVFIQYGNVTAGAGVAYSIHVGDGGAATVCLVDRAGVADWIEMHYGPATDRGYRPGATWGCAWNFGKAEAQQVSVPSGAVAFVLASDTCPQVDCSVHVRLEGLSWESAFTGDIAGAIEHARGNAS